MVSEARKELTILRLASKMISEVSPFYEREGSKISLKDYKDGILIIEVTGACVGCSLAENDLGALKEDFLREIKEINDVIFINSYGLPVI